MGKLLDKKGYRIGKVTKEWLLMFRLIDEETGCWHWTKCKFSNGYGAVQRNGKCEGCHRVAWECFKGPIPDGMMVLHRCDTKDCFNPDHLFIGTGSDNVQDCISKKRHYFGEACHLSKLTENQVRQIRESKASNQTIARLFNITRQNVWQIRTKRTWTTVS